MAGLIALVLMHVSMESARWVALLERLNPLMREVARILAAQKKKLEVERERLSRPVISRHETRWSITRTETGRVALVLEEYLHTTAEGGGRYATTRALLPEPTGTHLLDAVREQRDTLVEKTLAEGTRIIDLEKGLTEET